MKRLIILPLLIATASAQTFFYEGDALWTEDFTVNPFPNGTTFNAGRGFAWGDDTSAFTNSFLPQGGGALPSLAQWDRRGDSILVDGPAMVTSILTHTNNPIGDFWDDNNLSTGMGFSPARILAEIQVDIFSDVGRQDRIATIALEDEIRFVETFNSPGPVDDVWSASVPVVTQPFSYQGGDFLATVSLFHPPGDLDSTQTDFTSPEGGQSEGHIALRITSSVIPEPGSLFLVGGLFGLILALRRHPKCQLHSD